MFESLKNKIELAKIERQTKNAAEQQRKNYLHMIQTKEAAGQPLTAEESAVLYEEDRTKRLTTAAVISAIVAIPIGIAAGILVLNALDENKNNGDTADAGDAADPGDVADAGDVAELDDIADVE